MHAYAGAHQLFVGIPVQVNYGFRLIRSFIRRTYVSSIFRI